MQPIHMKMQPYRSQNVFRDSEIMISPACDSTGITSENWYQSEEKRRVVFGEVEKIGKYLGQF